MNLQKHGQRVTGLAVLAIAFVAAVATGIVLKQHTEFGHRWLGGIAFRPAVWFAAFGFFALIAIPLVRTEARGSGERVAMAVGIGIGLTLWWMLVMAILVFLGG